MINFIVYEDEIKFRDKYFSIIEKFIGDSNLVYEIIDIPKYTKEESAKIKNLSGNNIYILDIEVPGKSGLDLAREIRRNGDWKSQIIIATSHEHLKDYAYQSSMLMLAFISKFYNLERELYKAISKAYNILTTDECITFQKGPKIYNIPKHDVLYFEKQQEEVYCSVVTKDKSYVTNKTLIQLEKDLKIDPRFMKTHRNYLVNTYNIRKIDLDRDEISFENNKRALLSRTYKKEIKEISKLIEESRV